MSRVVSARNYYLNHIDKFKIKYSCECGGRFKYSNFFNHCKTKKHSLYNMDITLSKSNIRGKKYKVVIIDGDEKKTIHFGAVGYDDYTTHKDDERKQNYIKRHKKNEDWRKSGITTAGYWSRWLLWNKKTIKESISDIEKKFNVEIKTKK